MKIIMGRTGGGGGGGSLARFTNGKKIEDHGDKTFVFPNHENKQIRYFF